MRLTATAPGPAGSRCRIGAATSARPGAFSAESAVAPLWPAGPRKKERDGTDDDGDHLHEAPSVLLRSLGPHVVEVRGDPSPGRDRPNGEDDEPNGDCWIVHGARSLVRGLLTNCSRTRGQATVRAVMTPARWVESEHENGTRLHPLVAFGRGEASLTPRKSLVRVQYRPPMTSNELS